MSKPKNMTPEEEAAWLQKMRPINNAKAKKSWWKHREKRLEKQKKRREADPEKTKSQRNKSRAKWAETHPEQNKEYSARAAKNTRERITDNYVASVMRTPLKLLREHFPEAIEAKREEILARRSNPLTNKQKK